MRAIVLAAGRGSRMGQLTASQPKCLTQIRGKSLLAWQLGALRAAKIEDIALVTGYLHDVLAQIHSPCFINERWRDTNMVKSLTMARSWLKTTECIVSYSDIFYLPSAIEALKKNPANIVITYDPNWLSLWQARFDDPLCDAETFRIDTNACLLEIGGRAQSVDEIQGQYMGLLKITPYGWHEIERILSKMTESESNKLDMTGLLSLLIHEKRIPIAVVPYNEKWGEVDSADDMRFYNGSEFDEL